MSSKLTSAVDKTVDASPDATSGGEDPTPRFDGMRTEYETLEMGYHESLYTWLGSAYQEARNLLNTEASWNAYVASPWWEENNKKPPKNGSFQNILKVVLKHLLGYGKEKQKIVSKYKNAMIHLADIGVEAEDFRERLEEEGGIERCAAKASRRGQSKAPQQADADIATKALPESSSLGDCPTGVIPAQDRKIPADIEAALIELLSPHAPCEVRFKIGKSELGEMAIYDLQLADLVGSDVAPLGSHLTGAKA